MDDWSWPQWTYAFILALGLWAAAVQHNKPNEVNFHATMIGLCITLFLTWAGGFW